MISRGNPNKTKIVSKEEKKILLNNSVKFEKFWLI